MTVTVREAMAPEPIVLHPHTPLSAVAWAMAHYDVDAVLVGSNDRVRAFATDRDIVVHGLGAAREPEVTPIADVCRAGLVTIGPDEDLDEAIALLRRHGVDRLAVLESSRPVGTLTMADVARARARRAPSRAPGVLEGAGGRPGRWWAAPGSPV